MAIRLPGVLAKKILRQSPLKSVDVTKGFLAIFVGKVDKKRFMVPVSYLKEPSFQDLLCKAEEEFGFDHPMGGLTIPCDEETFLDVTSSLNRL